MSWGGGGGVTAPKTARKWRINYNDSCTINAYQYFAVQKTVKKNTPSNIFPNGQWAETHSRPKG